jgi:hypothetical protein
MELMKILNNPQKIIVYLRTRLKVSRKENLAGLDFEILAIVGIHIIESMFSYWYKRIKNAYQIKYSKCQKITLGHNCEKQLTVSINYLEISPMH